LIPFSLVAGQDSKSSQKIKIVVDDGSGTKVVIDTLLKDGQVTDSIRLKDGKVIFIGYSGDDVIVRPDKGTEHVFVTVTSDRKDSKKEVKEITIVSSDSATWTEAGEGDKVYVDSDDKESAIEKTRYVVAKDGIVVTVEGNDEAKVKVLIKEIENKLGVKSEGAENKEAVKVESKKAVKK
jgi:hypothetical protein